MTTHNATNERIKREYFAYLKEAKRHSEATVDAVAMALSRFEFYTRSRSFRNFRKEQAIAFKHYLAEQNGKASGERLSKSTLYATLAHLTRFFNWLSGRPGYKSFLVQSDADYFNLSAKETRIAVARREKVPPTVDQVKQVLATMPADSEIQRRNRALIAFILLTGARDTAVASMKLKHVDVAARSVFQDAREVRTKSSKTIVTTFFPVGEDVCQEVADWATYLRQVKRWGDDDPLFPATEVKPNKELKFEPTGLSRKHWSNADPIRRIFREAFKSADLPYFNPHSVRSALVRFGLSRCQTPEEFKAWSQNLGHEGVLTTFTSYGQVSVARQSEIIRNLAIPPHAREQDPVEFAKAVAREVLQAASEDSRFNPHP